MKRLIIFVLIVFMLFATSVQAAKIWPASGLTGGATGDLDDYLVANLTEGDSAFVFIISGTSTYVYWYLYDASGTDAEDSPNVIRPDDYSTQGNWRLAKITSSSLEIAKASGVAGLMGVYEANGVETSVTGFKGPANTADNMYYVFPNADPAVNQIWWFGATGSNESAIGLSYVYDAIEFVIDGGGAEIADNVQMDLEIPFGFEVIAWTVLADQSGSIVIDVWKTSYASFPPTVTNEMAASNHPTITTAVKGQDADGTLNWTTTTITAGDIVRINVDSCTTIERVTLSLKGYRTF